MVRGGGERPAVQSQAQAEDRAEQPSREEAREKVQVKMQQKGVARQLQGARVGRLDHRPAGLRSLPLRGPVRLSFALTP